MKLWNQLENSQVLYKLLSEQEGYHGIMQTWGFRGKTINHNPFRMHHITLSFLVLIGMLEKLSVGRFTCIFEPLTRVVTSLSNVTLY